MSIADLENKLARFSAESKLHYVCMSEVSPEVLQYFVDGVDAHSIEIAFIRPSTLLQHKEVLFNAFAVGRQIRHMEWGIHSDMNPRRNYSSEYHGCVQMMCDTLRHIVMEPIEQIERLFVSMGDLLRFLSIFVETPAETFNHFLARATRDECKRVALSTIIQPVWKHTLFLHTRNLHCDI
jgi:hypothetical protein